MEPADLVHGLEFCYSYMVKILSEKMGAKQKVPQNTDNYKKSALYKNPIKPNWHDVFIRFWHQNINRHTQDMLKSVYIQNGI